MTIIEALKTAIGYEERVRDTYRSAIDRTADPTGQRIFTLMSNEEHDHVLYLQKKLSLLEAGEAISSADLDTSLPDSDKIAAAKAALDTSMQDIARESEIAMLMKAREMEKQTSAFYEQMVAVLPPDGQAFFQRFVEIERGHLLLVEAEIDYLQHKGTWLAVDHGELKYF